MTEVKDAVKEQALAAAKAPLVETATAQHIARANPRIRDVVRTAQGIFLITDRNKNGVHAAISAKDFSAAFVHPSDILEVLGSAGDAFGTSLSVELELTKQELARLKEQTAAAEKAQAPAPAGAASAK